MAAKRHRSEVNWIEKASKGKALLRKGKESLSIEAEGCCCGKAWNRNALEMNRAAEKRNGIVQMCCEEEKKSLA